MLKCVGLFCLNTMVALRPFNKEYKTAAELVELLRSRGLIVEDAQKAKDYIENIGYYRMSAYMHPFLTTPKQDHIYKSGTTFRQVLRLYRFDKKLRMLLLNEIEKVEIAIREAVMNTPAEMTGDKFWLAHEQHFANRKTFEDTRRTIESEYRKSTEDFILHFKHTYDAPFPPVWILGELLTMGNVNMVYRNLKADKIRKRISQRFGLQPMVMESWITTLTLMRNACCHHSRVWNKRSLILPLWPRRTAFTWLREAPDAQRLYFGASIVKYFLNVISPNNDMRVKLENLLSQYPEIDVYAMGFPEGWEREPLWR